MKFVLAVLVVLAVLLSPAAFAQRTLDTFEDVSSWTIAPSDGVLLKVSQDNGALRLDFDFQGGAGYAVARRIREFSDVPIVILVLEQPMTVWSSFFYGEAAPETFSALPDG